MFAEKNVSDNDRYEQLRKWLDSDEYILPTRDLVECYFDFQKSNRVVFPFPGGRLDQPQWILSVFKTLERLEEFYKLKPKVVTTVSITASTP